VEHLLKVYVKNFETNMHVKILKKKLFWYWISRNFSAYYGRTL